MAAQAECSPNLLSRPSSLDRTLIALYGCMAVLVVAIGELALLGESWPRQMLEAWINIHALFGLLLCGLVLARYHWRIKHAVRMSATDVRELSRQLSRIVYLVLYVVIGVRLSIGIIGGIWHGGAADFNLLDDRLRNGPDYASFNPKDDFQMLLASGLLALIIVRVFAFRLWLRAVERAALSKAAGIESDPASK
jgi:cytochrome b561